MGVPCVTPPPPGGDDNEPTRSASEGLSDPGIEKKIPLRFINLLSCTPGPGCPDRVAYDDILHAVANANDVYKAVGLQFSVKSIERFHTPNLADMSSVACGGARDMQFEWAEVRNELQAIFPQTPDTAWASYHQKLGAWWLASVNTLYSPPDELAVWLVEDLKTGSGCSGASISQSPYRARSIEMRSIGFGAKYKLAHEIGHAIGLLHPWEWPPAQGPDPASGAPTVASDYWDLVYYPGPGGNEYFNSKTEAQQREADLRMIDKHGNCSMDSVGVVTCTIDRCTGCNPATEDKSTGHDAMKGLGFAFAGSAHGPNIMTYFDHEANPNAVSDSQIMRIRKHLRWAVQVDSYGTDKIKPNTIISTRLPLLGSWNLREVAQNLDFDGDGRRDIGVWTPPTTMGANGTFTVLLSSKGFSTTPGQFMNVPFGQLGDIPVVADYNGDGQTDLAVYQPGGGQYRNDPPNDLGYWHRCTTADVAENTTCSMYMTIQFGNREDVPLPGLLFAGSTPHLAIFRPNQGMWQWRPVGSGSVTTKYLGGRGSVLLPGQYDGDFLTDIAVYEPQTAYFELLRSQLSWGSPLHRGFGSTYVPLDGGSSADRSAPMPLSGIYRPQTICNPGCTDYPRSVFSLWDPYDGTWTTMWDPIASSDKNSCAWGWGAMDMPITGVDRNIDGYTDFVVYRGSTYDGPGYFYFKNATPGGCTGSTQSIYYQFGNRVRQRAFAVADMTGDGRPEIMLVQPDAMQIQWMKSEDGYTIVNTRTIGNERSIVL